MRSRFVDFSLIVLGAFALLILLAIYGQMSAGTFLGAALILFAATLLSYGTALMREERAQRLRDATASGPDEFEFMSKAIADRIIDQFPDPLILVHRGRRVVRNNRAAQDLFGSDLGGRDLSAFLRNPDLLDAVDRVSAGAESASAEFTLPVPVERFLHAEIVRIRSDRASGDVMLIAMRDMTPIKRSEEMRADFVANVSHELRTPLAAMSGFIETLKGPAREDEEARTRFLEIMQEQAARMGRLIDDLLSLSRIEDHEHVAPRGEINLGSILGSVIGGLEPIATAEGVEVVCTVALDKLPKVSGERGEIEQVFQNLIDNSIKYSGKGATVTISRVDSPRHSAGDTVAVAVKDTGPGIPREHLPRLTERFYRVNTGKSRQKGGTGLGLAIVKHILNRHRGSLHISSVEGEGSVFTVVLPVAGAESAKAKDETALPA